MLVNLPIRVQERRNKYKIVVGSALAYHYKTKQISYIFYLGTYQDELTGAYIVCDLITGLPLTCSKRQRLEAIQDAITKLNNNTYYNIVEIINKIELARYKNVLNGRYYRISYFNMSVINKINYYNHTYTVGFIPDTDRRVLMRTLDINKIKIKGV